MAPMILWKNHCSTDVYHLSYDRWVVCNYVVGVKWCDRHPRNNTGTRRVIVLNGIISQLFQAIEIVFMAFLEDIDQKRV